MFNKILRSSGSNHVQCTFEWLSLWLKHLGKDCELFTLIAQEGEDVIGVAPFIIQKRAAYKGIMKLRTLSFIGYGFTDNSDLVIAGEREEITRAFFDHVFESHALWDEIRLTQLSDASPNFALIKKELAREGHDIEVEPLIGCPYVKIEGEFDTYYQALGKNLKHDVARRTRKLKGEGVELDFDVVTRLDEDGLRELRQLNRRRFDATRHRSFFLNDDRYNFLREVAKTFNERGWWRLFTFRSGGTLVAYHLCFAYNDVVYNWNTSYDVDYYKYSLGKILLKPVLEYCFREGYKIFDFMAGDEDYKFKWTKTMWSNYEIVVQKKTLKAKLARTYSSARKRLKKQ